MAALKSKSKFKTELVTAIDSFVTSALPGGIFPVAAGARFRREHPVVEACAPFSVTMAHRSTRCTACELGFSWPRSRRSHRRSRSLQRKSA